MPIRRLARRPGRVGHAGVGRPHARQVCAGRADRRRGRARVRPSGGAQSDCARPGAPHDRLQPMARVLRHGDVAIVIGTTRGDAELAEFR